MRLTESRLRRLIRQTLYESATVATHRTMGGEDVQFGCQSCVDDLGARIQDATYHRDGCTRGSADRASYNGLLSALRRALRAALKELDAAAAEEESEVVVEIEPLV